MFKSRISSVSSLKNMPRVSVEERRSDFSLERVFETVVRHVQRLLLLKFRQRFRKLCIFFHQFFFALSILTNYLPKKIERWY